MESPFAYVVCRPGSEALLKQELAASGQDLRLAFSRPGFITFKGQAPFDETSQIPGVFVRSSGLALGPFSEARVQEVIALAQASSRRLRLAAFPMSATCHAELDEALRRKVETRAASLNLDRGLPSAGELVLDLAVGDSDWLGLHVHASERSPHPGGLLPIALHPEAPSRAYLKIEEAIARFDLPMRRGQRVVELGSAPGGAAFALLTRGLQVIGVDPGEMDPRVAGMPGFTRMQLPAGALEARSLPRPVDWFLADMNLAPQVSLRYCERIIGPLRRTLVGCVITLKLNDAAAVRAIPSLLDRVRSFGFEVRATQLPSNGREMCVVGMAATSRPGSR